MTRSIRFLAAATGALTLALASAPLSAQRGIGVGLAHAPGLSQPTTVDCTLGESLQAALDAVPQNTDQITIEIHGFCAEPILIKRKVIIRGTDPQTDGIAGPSTGNSSALVSIFGVDEFWRTGIETIRLEHLTIKDSSNIGLSINISQLGLDDVIIRNNANIGIGAFPGSFVSATNTTIADNGGSGVLSQGRFGCANCTLSGNGTSTPAGLPAIAADQAGKVILTNTTIAGTAGLQAQSSGEVTMVGGSITAATRAATIQNGGHMFFQSGTLMAGSVICSLQGILDSRRGTGTAGFTQTSNAGGGNNSIANGCVFLAGPGTTTLTGTTVVTAGAFVATEGPANGTTVRFNALACSGGGKVTGATITVNNVPGVPAGCGT